MISRRMMPNSLSYTTDSDTSMAANNITMPSSPGRQETLVAVRHRIPQQGAEAAAR